jgi:hypothetical protein
VLALPELVDADVDTLPVTVVAVAAAESEVATASGAGMSACKRMQRGRIGEPASRDKMDITFSG